MELVITSNASDDFVQGTLTGNVYDQWFAENKLIDVEFKVKKLN